LATVNKIEFKHKNLRFYLFQGKETKTGKLIFTWITKDEQNEEMKYLGIYIDSTSNFNAHIDHTVVTLITLVNMLGRTAKLQWGKGIKLSRQFVREQ